MTYLPQRGDLVLLDIAPGTPESQPVVGFVLSGKSFNQHGLAVICPIDQDASASPRTYGTVVTLFASGMKTRGAIHCHLLGAVDWRTRHSQFIEAAPKNVIEEVLARSEALIFD